VLGDQHRKAIDDRADLALALPFAGVQLGQRDLPPRAARAILRAGVAIGASTHDEAQLVEAAEDDAVDVVAFGPVFGTASKENADPPVGLDRLAAARARTAKPLVAIGGIGERQISAVAAAGVDAIAVLSAACAGDIRANCRRLLAALRAADER